MADGWPPIVDDLHAWLMGQGFREEERHYDRRVFGNWLIVLVRAPCRVRLVRDRSQWFLDLSGEGLRDWHGPNRWRGCLEGEDASPLDLSFNDGVAYVRRALPDIVEALRTRSNLEACLHRQIGRRREDVLGALPTEEPGE